MINRKFKKFISLLLAGGLMLSSSGVNVLASEMNVAPNATKSAVVEEIELQAEDASEVAIAAEDSFEEAESVIGNAAGKNAEITEDVAEKRAESSVADVAEEEVSVAAASVEEDDIHVTPEEIAAAGFGDLDESQLTRADKEAIKDGAKIPVLKTIDKDDSVVASDFIWDDDEFTAEELEAAALAYYNPLASSSNPTSYLPDTRNQNPYGTCWAHATIGAMEVSLTKSGAVDPDGINLSESLMAWFTNNTPDDPMGNFTDKEYHWNGDEYNSGGWGFYASQALQNGIGASSESADSRYKYNSTNIEKIRNGSMTLSNEDAYNTEYVLKERIDVNTNNLEDMKAAISKYGAVTIGYFAYDPYSAYYTGGDAYQNGCYNTTENYFPYGPRSNHEVMVVGWDDNFSKSNFKYQPKNDGAWLIRNSWYVTSNDKKYNSISDYSEVTYFWMSYDDASLADRGFVFEAMPASEYDNCFALDASANRSGTVYSSDATYANVFTNKTPFDQAVTALGMDISAVNPSDNNVTISIYTGVTDKTKLSGKKYSKNVKLTNAGFKMVDFSDCGISIEPGEMFTVALECPKSTGVYYEYGGNFDGYSMIDYGWGPSQAYGNYDLKAYTKEVSSEPFDIYLDPNWGDIPSGEYTKTVIYKSTYGSLPTPVRRGYDFIGWFTEIDGGSQVTSTTKVTNPSAHTLYAHWKGKDIRVTLDPQGGTLNATLKTRTVQYGNVYGTDGNSEKPLPKAVKEESFFLGWFTEPSGGERVLDDTECFNDENHTLYAHYAGKNDIVLQKNCGDVEDPNDPPCDSMTVTLYGDGRAVIAGSGKMFCGGEKGLFDGYEDEVKKVEIDPGVTSIDDNAFRDCINLEGELDLSNIESVGQLAFLNCKKISGDLDLTKLKDIGGAAFANCTSLDSVKFGKQYVGVYFGYAVGSEDEKYADYDVFENAKKGFTMYIYGGTEYAGSDFINHYKDRKYVITPNVYINNAYSVDPFTAVTYLGDTKADSWVYGNDQYAFTIYGGHGPVTYTMSDADKENYGVSVINGVPVLTYAKKSGSFKIQMHFAKQGNYEEYDDEATVNVILGDPIQVTFDYNGGMLDGNASSTVDVLPSNRLDNPALANKKPTKKGHSLTGKWYTDATRQDASTEWNFNKRVYSDNNPGVLYAEWEGLSESITEDDAADLRDQLEEIKKDDGGFDKEADDISPEDIPENLWMTGVKDAEYNGSAVTWPVNVFFRNTKLTAGKDYKATYKNNVKAGTATLTVTGKGDYSGKIVKNFKINKLSLEDTNAVIESTPAILQKKSSTTPQKGTPVIKYTKNGKTFTLKKGTDFTVTYPGTQDGYPIDDSITPYVSAGVYDVIIKGKGNFTGEYVAKEIITDNQPASKLIITVKTAAYDDMPENIAPAIDVKKKGCKSSLYGVQLFDLSDAKNTYFNGSDYGKEYMFVDSYGIDNDYAYVVNADIQKQKGTVTIFANPNKGFHGMVTKSFNIATLPISKAVFPSLSNYVYSGFAFEPFGSDVKTEAITQGEYEITNKDGYVLYNGADYKVSYKNNINTGKATATITGIGRYSGTVKKTFKINQLNMATSPDIEAYLTEISVPYAKGGAKPKPVVKYNGVELKLNTDYKVTYSNNGKAGNLAKAIITGKGNFKGAVPSNDYLQFVVESRELTDNISVTISDVIAANKPGIPSAPKASFKDLTSNTKLLKDDLKQETLNGKPVYEYAESATVTEVTVENGVKHTSNIAVNAGDTVESASNKYHIVKPGTEIRTYYVPKKDTSYMGRIPAEFSVVSKDISKAKVKIGAVTYTGKAFTAEDLIITSFTLGGVKIPEYVDINEDGVADDNERNYKIESLSKNLNKGKGTAVISGCNMYGGKVSVTFDIKAKSMNYTVKYDANAATYTGKMSNSSLSNGGKVAANKYKREGYKFVGWSRKPVYDLYAGASDILAQYKDDGTIITGDKGSLNLTGKAFYGDTVTLYAVWMEK